MIVGPLSYPPNEPIPLSQDLRVSVARDNADVRHDWEGERIACRARLRLSPKPGLELVSRGETPLTRPGQGANDILTFRWGSGNRGRFFWTSQRTNGGEETSAVETVWVPAKQPILVRSGREASVSELRCGVINFPRFSGRRDDVLRGDGGGLSRRGRVRAQAGPWSIELNECGNSRDRFDELDATRGFALTHEARIVRDDGESIVVEQASLLLRALDDFLSFARGSCCCVALVQALDESEEVVWEQWGSRRVDPWQRFRSSWFDSQKGHVLEEALPGFWDVYGGCRDERRALHDAIYWYLRSDTRQSGVDGGLILMQAALERLAHTFYRPKNGSAEPTACWLRDALADRQIPVEIHRGSEALTTYVDSVVKKREVSDAVFAVTKLRNNAVHPDKDAGVPDGAYYEAWKMARWLVEMMVLNVTGYEGEYANRLTRRFVGQVERVPWVRSD